MNIVSMRIWKVRDLIIGWTIYLVAISFATLPTGHLRMFGIMALIAQAALVLVHDPNGAATLRGVIRWEEWTNALSNRVEPDLFWLAFWRFVYWLAFPVTQGAVYVLAFVQRDRQRAAWRSATEAWLRAFEDEAAAFHNPALDPNNDAPDDTPHKKRV